MHINGKKIMTVDAIIITNGYLATSDAKTAHGLIRGSERFNIVGVIDPVHAGQDAGEVLDGIFRGIPVVSSIKALADKIHANATHCIIGVALHGGRLPEDWRSIVLEALGYKMTIVNGLHQPLGDDPFFRETADRNGAAIIDIRKPGTFDQLPFWTGDIFNVKAATLAVLGMDCAIGKRTTCRFILDMCRANGIRTEMIYTGQTGWMQGYPYGFILDATPNDFIPGEIEKAIVACDREVSPDLILLEGQSSLRNPFGPCGSEFLISGNVKGVILQHVPFRTFFEDLEKMGCRLPEVEDEIKLVEMYGAKTLAVTLNGDGGDSEGLATYQKELSEKLQIPVIRPLEEGVEALLADIRQFMEKG
ncbi:MAG: DUF1611 domain-containing protein [Deltaproteobacteria bacterium]|nr:DUF1611 domain-containing protein [Deltaproteobacteria bacterium]MBW2676062.1 DUF1611 domain-containing protein [Deltaproteobacteria bacterium]